MKPRITIKTEKAELVIPLSDCHCEHCDAAVKDIALALTERGRRVITLTLTEDRNASGTLMGYHLEVETRR